MTREELWQATLAQIQFKISPANFATWFRNTYILSKKEGELVISAPNNFSKEWLENKYNKILFQALHGLDLEIKRIKYTVERSAGKPRDATSSRPMAMPQESQLEFQELKVDRSTSLNPRYTFDNFVVAPFNELAHAASLAIVKDPGTVYNPLFVYGGTGLGKTHLLQAIGNKIVGDVPQKKLKYISSERFTSSVVSAIRNHTVDALRSMFRDLDVLIVDDVQFLTGKDKTQEELFHTFNALYEAGKQIIFSSDRPPKAIPALEERLRSRFEGGMIADISMPDFETRLAILRSKMQEKVVSLDDEICEYVASHIQRNIRELEGALNRLAAFIQLNGKSPTFADAKTLLRSVIQNPSKMVNHKKSLPLWPSFMISKKKRLSLLPERRRWCGRAR